MESEAGLYDFDLTHFSSREPVSILGSSPRICFARNAPVDSRSLLAGIHPRVKPEDMLRSKRSSRFAIPPGRQTKKAGAAAGPCLKPKLPALAGSFQSSLLLPCDRCLHR